MANRCENDLWVAGDSKDIKKLLEHIKGNCEEAEILFDFNKLIPYPQKFRDVDKAAAKEQDESKRPPDGFNSGGYQWCIENWGTMWNPYWVEMGEISENGENSSVTIKFATAWSPPNPI